MPALNNNKQVPAAQFYFLLTYSPFQTICLMIRVRSLFIAILFLCSVPAMAQRNYSYSQLGAGLRFSPDGAGLSLRYLMSMHFSLEGQLNASAGTDDDHGQSVTAGVLACYNITFSDPSWRVYLGGGAHTGTWRQYKDDRYPSQNIVGLDAGAGAEYMFVIAPVAISLDVKPAVNFMHGLENFPNNTFGLSVRYYLGARNQHGRYLFY